MYIIQKRLFKVGLFIGISLMSIAIVSVILTGINQFKLGSQLANIKQVSHLSHLFVRQQARIFSLMLVKNAKLEELIDALDAFAKEDFVIDANLYSVSGNLIAQSHNALEFKVFSDENETENKIITQQIVEPIFSQQELMGFLRVTFDAQYTQINKTKVNTLFNRLYGELIILFLTGGLWVSSTYYFWRNWHKRQIPPHSLVKTHSTSTISQSQRFHSRRKAFQRKRL